MTELAVILNPVKLGDDRDAIVETIGKACAERGWSAPLVLETTAEDPGDGMVGQALEHGVRRIVVCGGDGTVAACASSLARRAPYDPDAERTVGLGLIPLGTGNLLALNLELPTTVEEALAVALGDRGRPLDVLRTGDRGFVVMAGLGLDAAMMEQTSEKLKARIGWPAYVGGLLRGLVRNRRVRYRVSIDGQPDRVCPGIGVLVANVGKIQGGIDLVPDAEPDDGTLDVLMLVPHGVRGWVSLIVDILRRRAGTSGLERGALVGRGRRVRIEASAPVACEFDGDPAEATDSLEIEVQPSALWVYVGAQTTG